MVNEEREDPFQDITLSGKEEANDEVNVIDNADEDGDDQVDEEGTTINVTFSFSPPQRFKWER